MGDGEARVDMAPEHSRIVRAIVRRHGPDVPVWVFGSRARSGAKACPTSIWR